MRLSLPTGMKSWPFCQGIFDQQVDMNYYFYYDLNTVFDEDCGMFSMFCRIEGKGKGILQNHQLIAEFESISEENRKHLTEGAFGEVLRATQVTISPFLFALLVLISLHGSLDLYCCMICVI